MNNSKVEKEEGGESHYLGKAETSKKVQSLSALAGQMLMPFINITEHWVTPVQDWSQFDLHPSSSLLPPVKCCL